MRRGIHLPPRRLVLGAAFTIFAFMTVTVVGWALLVGRGFPLPTLGISLLLSASLFALIWATIGVMHRLEAAGWRFEEPRISRWVVFYGSWSAVGLAIGLGRLAMVQARSPVPLSAGQAVFVVFLCLYVTLAMMVLLEHQTMFRATIARKREASLMAVRFLFGTREAFAQARDHRRHEALTVLERKLDPELTDAQARLALNPSPEALEPLMSRLESLRSVDIREVSHLLHPSIIDMGLVPALRALVRNRKGDLPLVLDIVGVTPEDGSPEVWLHLYRIVEHVLDLARTQPFREVRISLERVGGGRLRLEIVGSGEPLDRALLRDLGARALVDARVAMLGGTWRFEDSGRERLALWVELPPANGLEDVTRA